MKALRRSIKGDKDKDRERDRRSDEGRQNAAPPSIQKLAVAIMPPKKVIRAKDSFQARTPLELSFEEGDFFHVIDREEDPDFYEACNPALPDARGYVPVVLFQVLGRTGAECEPNTKRERPPIPPPIDIPLGSGTGYAIATSSAAASINRPGIPVGAPISMPMTPGHRSTPSLGKNGPMVYGVVVYDFNAERADELEAKTGEAIIVIAQSNPEWFVAKPIGRLGGPGLIPVSYVQIRDMVTGQALTDPSEAIRQAGVPRVEEWKKMAADYKNSSITLGKFEGPGASAPYADQQAQAMQQALERVSIQPNQQQQQNGQRGSDTQQGYSEAEHAETHQRGPGGSNPDYRSNQSIAAGAANTNGVPADQLRRATMACVTEWHSADEQTRSGDGIETKYWFILQAKLDDGEYWALARYYEDFYVFQVDLLADFPEEAGKVAGRAGAAPSRTLPYMPGPIGVDQVVTAAITEGRLRPLDKYVKEFLSQPPRISGCIHARKFFAPRVGDFRIDRNTFERAYQETSDPTSPLNKPSAPGQYDEPRFSGPTLSPETYEPPGSQLTERQQQKAPMPAASEAPIKIKMYFNGDLIALRVPSDIQFQQLSERIRQRLRLSSQDQLELFYRDEPTGNKPNLMSDNDLDYALQRNEKLLLYAEVV